MSLERAAYRGRGRDGWILDDEHNAFGGEHDDERSRRERGLRDLRSESADW